MRGSKQMIVDRNGNIIGSINGEGIFDFLDPKKNGVNKTINKVAEKVGLNKAVDYVAEKATKIGEVAKRVWNGRTGLPPKVIKILEEYGDAPISAITIDRSPVGALLTGMMNAVSLGSFNKKFGRLPYDKLYHLRLDITTSQGKFKMEKNEVINMDKDPIKKEGGEQEPLSSVPSGLTMNSLMEGAKEYMGAKFIPYSAYNNNCQDFILGVLKGSKLGNETDYTFIKQNTDTLFQKDPTLRKVANTLTDLGAKVNVITSGGEGIWRGTGLMVDADDDQVLLPFLSEYMMVLPPYMIKRNNKKKGYKYKLVNPLTQERYLAKRTGKTSVEVKRKLVDKPYFVDDDNEDKPYVRDFSPEDRKLLLEYDKRVSEYEDQIDEKDYANIPDVAFKNLERGRPLPCEGATARKKKAKVVKAKADQRKPYDNSQFEREEQKAFDKAPNYWKQDYHSSKYKRASKYHNDENYHKEDVERVEQFQHTKGHIAKEKAKAKADKIKADAEAKRLADLEAIAVEERRKAGEERARVRKEAEAVKAKADRELYEKRAKIEKDRQKENDLMGAEERPQQNLKKAIKDHSHHLRYTLENPILSNYSITGNSYELWKKLLKLLAEKPELSSPEITKVKDDIETKIREIRIPTIADVYSKLPNLKNQIEDPTRWENGGNNKTKDGIKRRDDLVAKATKEKEMLDDFLETFTKEERKEGKQYLKDAETKRTKYLDKEKLKTELKLLQEGFRKDKYLNPIARYGDLRYVYPDRNSEDEAKFMKEQQKRIDDYMKTSLGKKEADEDIVKRARLAELTKLISGEGIENKISGDIIKMPNAWVSYVKDFAAKNGMKYNEALKSAECKAGYKSGGAIYNPKNDPAITAQNRVIADNMNGRSRLNAFVHNNDDLAGRKFISM
jgi:hypothetical protein